MKKEYPAKIFNDKRRILFSTIAKDKYDFKRAEDYLEGYKESNVLNHAAYVGLKAEIEFFKNFRLQYKLTEALDCGDHTDFSAVISGEAYKIDVTTNPKYKKYARYEPFQKLGAKYKIAVLDKNNFELVDINFRECSNCNNNNKMFPIVEIVKHCWNNELILRDICVECNNNTEIKRLEYPYLETPREKINNYQEYAFNNLEYDSSDFELKQKTIHENAEKMYKQESNMLFRYARKSFNQFLSAIGTKVSETYQDGDEFWSLQYDLVHPFVEDYLHYGCLYDEPPE